MDDDIEDPDADRADSISRALRILFGPDSYRFNDPWDMGVDERAQKELGCPF